MFPACLCRCVRTNVGTLIGTRSRSSRSFSQLTSPNDTACSRCEGSLRLRMHARLLVCVCSTTGRRGGHQEAQVADHHRLQRAVRAITHRAHRAQVRSLLHLLSPACWRADCVCACLCASVGWAERRTRPTLTRTQTHPARLRTPCFQAGTPSSSSNRRRRLCVLCVCVPHAVRVAVIQI